MNKLMALGALALIVATGCAQDHTATGPMAARAIDLSVQAAAQSNDAPGAVYALTNAAAGNAVAMYTRGADGSLWWVGSVSTGGTGAGASLGSQGALALSDDGRWVFA